MRRIPSTVVTLVLPFTLIALFRGCSENKHSVSAADFAGTGTELVSAFCDWQARCCTGAEIASASHGRYMTADQCRTAGLQLNVQDQLSLPAASIDEGRIEVSGDRLDACIAAYRDRPCTNTTFSATAPDVNVLLECPDAIKGLVPLGRRCDTVVDCVAGAHCYFDANTNNGICVANRQEGDPCDPNDDCGPSLSCRLSDLTCVPTQADAGASTGATCTGPSDGGGGTGGTGGAGGGAGSGGGGGTGGDAGVNDAASAG
jgi:hypothetical protein